MLELSLQTSFVTFCSRGISSAATLLVENTNSSSLLEIQDNKMPKLGIELVGHIRKDSTTTEASKKLNSLSFQSTVSFLPISMIRYQW